MSGRPTQSSPPRPCQEVTRSTSGVAGDCQTLCGSLLSQETQRSPGVEHHQETSPALYWPLLPGEDWENKEGETN